MTNAVTAWSFSRWEQYDQCPLKFKLKNIDKLPEPSSPAMDRGTRIHNDAEKFLTANAPLTEELRLFEGLFYELRALPGVVADQKTLQWGYTQAWRPTGWFGRDTWFRSVLDAFAPYQDDTATGLDFKTGKKRSVSFDQIETQAMAVFCRIPSLKAVEMRLWYLDSGEEAVQTFTAAQVPALREKWEERVAPMFSDTVFAPRPNDKCRFCHYRQSNGGPCRFG